MCINISITAQSRRLLKTMATSFTSDEKITQPLETRVNMDKDYDYYIDKYKVPSPPPHPSNLQRNHVTGRYQGNLGVMPMEPVMEQVPMGTPPRTPTAVSPPGIRADAPSSEDEALLDLAQLEELHHEAERMKALGNKHMAAQVISWKSEIGGFCSVAPGLIFVVVVFPVTFLRSIQEPTTPIQLLYSYPQ